MIHRAARIGFSRSADAYERARPGYPAEAVDHLVSRLRAGARVLDLAAGTGKLTRPLMAAGLDVIAVEDLTETVAAVARRRCSARAERAQVLRQLEGEEDFERRQRFLDTVATLARERRVSRFALLAQKPR